MSTQYLSEAEQAKLLALLANGVIPADETDRGAAEADAGAVLAARIAQGVHAKLYSLGLDAACTAAQTQFGKPLDQLEPGQIHEVLLALKATVPGFYKQLRGDVTSLYLNTPGVWERIGFPGASAHAGGYPDFDQPQQDRRKG
ncbi:gluconate 2-dehydrogenase subunit 3 family protein [Paenibacillus sp. NPDC056579]|uniref:gluconate 2-dehydrogenase subunit 3 family protein n=1 Tax=unclassified Paenibacillus TaxID=185978 RepID=UPI001EF9ABC3|nr:gluconate 2-dehydrogenase subunit 3 family protein [Paenibacillus sp. H1-7]ULL13121.1 gluconate 2-dehydrogenase subunit 3 family protein [Paenibacillus sp. H1-7]